MVELLRDPIWQFVGLICSIILALVIYRLQQNRKRVSFEIISQRSQFNIDDTIKGDLQITYQNRLVEDLSVVLARIYNSGNVPIVPSDFYRPIAIQFNAEVEVLQASVWGEPDDLQPVLKAVNKEQAVIQPLLLNSGDAVVFEILLSNFDGMVFVDGRIAGVNSIHPKNDIRNSVIATIFMALASLGTAISVFVNGVFIYNNKNQFWYYGILVLIMGLLFLIVSIHDLFKHKGDIPLKNYITWVIINALSLVIHRILEQS